MSEIDLDSWKNGKGLLRSILVDLEAILWRVDEDVAVRGHELFDALLETQPFGTDAGLVYALTLIGHRVRDIARVCHCAPRTVMRRRKRVHEWVLRDFDADLVCRVEELCGGKPLKSVARKSVSPPRGSV